MTENNIRPNTWKNIFCFQILNGNVNYNTIEQTYISEQLPREISEKSIKVISLCADNKVSMEEWMNSIKEFHNCQVKNSMNSNKEVSMKKQLDSLYSKRMTERMSLEESLISEQNDLRSHEELSMKQTTENFDKELENIKIKLEQQQVIQLRQRRLLEERNRQVNLQREKMMEEQNCLEQLAQIRQMKEEENAENLIDKVLIIFFYFIMIINVRKVIKSIKSFILKLKSNYFLNRKE